MSFFWPKNCERNERFLLFCFPSFIYLIQNTRNTASFTVVGFWGQRGGGAVGVIILAVTDDLNPTARKVQRSRMHTPKTERGGVRYKTPNRRWLDGSGPHWCRRRATTGLLMFLLLGATGNHQSWAETGLCGLLRDLQRTACSRRHGLFPWRKTEERKRDGEKRVRQRERQHKDECTAVGGRSWRLSAIPPLLVQSFVLSPDSSILIQVRMCTFFIF